MAKKQSAQAVEEIGGEKKKLGGRYSIFPEDITIIGLDTADGPEHPAYDDRIKLPLAEEDIRDVMANCKNDGPGIILDPAVYTDKQGRTVVIDGRQRVRWMREVNKRLIDAGGERRRIAVVNKGNGDDFALLFGMQISANEHRVESSLTTRLRNLERFIVMQGDDLEDPSTDTFEEAATRFRVSIATIKNWHKARKLAEPVLDLVASEKLQMVPALTLAKLPAEHQIAEARKIVDLGLKGTAAVEAARSARDNAPPPSPSPATTGSSSEGAGEKPERNRRATATPPQPTIKPRFAQVNNVLGLALEDRRTGIGSGEELHEEFIRALRWVCGDLPAKSVKGLTELLTRSVSETPVRPVTAKPRGSESED